MEMEQHMYGGHIPILETNLLTSSKDHDNINSPTDVKPIKLRSACNHCFSAKVRCDGNKSGCRRCNEKQLGCTYSESRVGKVVGKRRKRPRDDSVCLINSEGWDVSRFLPDPSVPSPPTTISSYVDTSTERHCSGSSWTSFVASEDQALLETEDSTDFYPSIDMIDHQKYSTPSELSFFRTNGLPTPAFSPPQVRYLSPAALETRPVSRQTSITVDSTKLQPTTYSTVVPPTAPLVTEDDETICMKLLAHVKRHSENEHYCHEAQINLLRKSNAALRRILQSKTISSDYSCHLLLSAILIQLVGLYEKVCGLTIEDSKMANSTFLQDQLHFETGAECFDINLQRVQRSTIKDRLKPLIEEAALLTESVGDLLKRKPLNGYQMLGRHESLHIILGHRLGQLLPKS